MRVELPIDRYLVKFEGPPFLAQNHPHTWRLLHDGFRLSYADAGLLLQIEPDEVAQLLGGDSSPSSELLERTRRIYGVGLFQGHGLPGVRPMWEMTGRALRIAASAHRLKSPQLAQITGMSERFVRELLTGEKSEPGPERRELLGAALGVTLFHR